jgi:hypothetical protein
MISGKDVFDQTSAGGWNKKELEKFLDNMASLGWTRPQIQEVKPESVQP